MIVAAVSQLIDDSDDDEDDLEDLRRAHRQQLGRGSSDISGTVNCQSNVLRNRPPAIPVPELVFERALYVMRGI